jgi:glycine/D-amino acid oxidase-like deaminating enzyme
MELSYWEYKTWLSHIDFTIVGSGIVGLSCALNLKERFPKAKILVLEKGMLPQGASTKNAGFACFGSISEVLADLESHSEQEVIQLVQKRWRGIQLLRKTLGDDQINFQRLGGHELFLNVHDDVFQKCSEKMAEINALLHPVFGSDPFESTENKFKFKEIKGQYITHVHEGQIDTGQMMAGLLSLSQKKDILILNSVTVGEFVENQTHVRVKTDQFEFKTNKLFIATNGFVASLLKEDIKPARAQILMTKPIKNLQVKGTFHLDQGYYYFRNVDDRILLGGGRNLDFETEETTVFGKTELVQNHLETLLKINILPNTDFEIDFRWSGIMGAGPQKTPIVKQVSEHVFCGVRLGGMGIAIGSLIGKELSELL